LRRSWFQASSGTKFVRPCLNRKIWALWHICHPSYGRKHKLEDRGPKEKPYLQNNLSKKGCRVAQVVEHLPSKFKALSSNSGTTKRKTKASLPELPVCNSPGSLASFQCKSQQKTGSHSPGSVEDSSWDFCRARAVVRKPTRAGTVPRI
jgi:hypothetical protein